MAQAYANNDNKRRGSGGGGVSGASHRRTSTRRSSISDTDSDTLTADTSSSTGRLPGSGGGASSASGAGAAAAGWPRTIVVPRTEQGFGFTLRHFIVYPPAHLQDNEPLDLAVDDHTVDDGSGGGGAAASGGGSRLLLMEPMDTIFVKQVKPGGPASDAGLCTGDRIVCVNGETVTDKSYSQVIALIQDSESSLRLLVVPKDEDVIQMAYKNSIYSTVTQSTPSLHTITQQYSPIHTPHTTTSSTATLPHRGTAAAHHHGGATHHATGAAGGDSRRLNHRARASSDTHLLTHRDLTAQDLSVPLPRASDGGASSDFTHHTSHRHMSSSSGSSSMPSAVQSYKSEVRMRTSGGGAHGPASAYDAPASGFNRLSTPAGYVAVAQDWESDSPAPVTPPMRVSDHHQYLHNAARHRSHQHTTATQPQVPKRTTSRSITLNQYSSDQQPQHHQHYNHQQHQRDHRDRPASSSTNNQHRSHNTSTSRPISSSTSHHHSSYQPYHNSDSDSALTRDEHVLSQDRAKIRRTSDGLMDYTLSAASRVSDYCNAPNTTGSSMRNRRDNSRHSNEATTNERKRYSTLLSSDSVERDECPSDSSGRYNSSAYMDTSDSSAVQPHSNVSTGVSAGSTTGVARRIPNRLSYPTVQVSYNTDNHNLSSSPSSYGATFSLKFGDHNNAHRDSYNNDNRSGSVNGNGRQYRKASQDAISTQDMFHQRRSRTNSLPYTTAVGASSDRGMDNGSPATIKVYFRGDQTPPNKGTPELQRASKHAAHTSSSYITPQPYTDDAMDGYVEDAAGDFDRGYDGSRCATNGSIVSAGSSSGSSTASGTKARRQPSYLTAVDATRGAAAKYRSASVGSSSIGSHNDELVRMTSHNTVDGSSDVTVIMREQHGEDVPLHDVSDNKVQRSTSYLMATAQHKPAQPPTHIDTTGAGGDETDDGGGGNYLVRPDYAHTPNSIYERQHSQLRNGDVRVQHRKYLRQQYQRLSDIQEARNSLEGQQHIQQHIAEYHKQQCVVSTATVATTKHQQPLPDIKERVLPDKTGYMQHNGQYAANGASDATHEAFVTPTRTSIRKLKAFFGERTPRIMEATTEHTRGFITTATTASTMIAAAAAAAPNGEVIKEGMLNCKLSVMDGKRASDRSWRPMWVCLRGHCLYQFKDKAAASDSMCMVSPPMSEEQPISIKSSIADIAYDYTKKKHVLRLTTYNGSEYLFQAEDHDDMLDWIRTIQENNNPDDDDNHIAASDLILRKTTQYEQHSSHKSSSSPQSSSSSHHKTLTKKSSAKTLRAKSPAPPGRGSNSSGHSHANSSTTNTSSSGTGQVKYYYYTEGPRTRDLKDPPKDTSLPPGTVPLAYTTNTTTTSTSAIGTAGGHQGGGGSKENSSGGSSSTRTWRGKMVSKLKRYGSSSSTPVEVSGTFDVPLEMCPMSKAVPHVPHVVVLCTSIVEERGLDNQGIYRVPGNTGAVNTLQEELNKHGENIDITEDERWLDVNVVSSLLKSFFRRLPEPLITADLYHPIITANRIENPERRMLLVKKLLHELPEAYFETFYHVAKHLNKVMTHEANKMDARNLAIVFGPTLVHPVDEKLMTMVQDMSDQCRLVESIILHYEWFFSSWDVDHEVPVDIDDNNPVSSINQELISKAQNLARPDLAAMSLGAGGGGSGGAAKELVSSLLSAANLRKKKKDKQLTKSSDSTESTSDMYLENTLKIKTSNHSSSTTATSTSSTTSSVVQQQQQQLQQSMSSHHINNNTTATTNVTSHILQSKGTSFSSSALSQHIGSTVSEAKQLAATANRTQSASQLLTSSSGSASAVSATGRATTSASSSASTSSTHIDIYTAKMKFLHGTSDTGDLSCSGGVGGGDWRLGSSSGAGSMSTPSSSSTTPPSAGADVKLIKYPAYTTPTYTPQHYRQTENAKPVYFTKKSPSRVSPARSSPARSSPPRLDIMSPPSTSTPLAPPSPGMHPPLSPSLSSYEQYRRDNQQQAEILKRKQQHTLREEARCRQERQRIEAELERTQRELELDDDYLDCPTQSHTQTHTYSSIPSLPATRGLGGGSGDTVSVTSDYSTMTSVSQRSTSGSTNDSPSSSHARRLFNSYAGTAGTRGGPPGAHGDVGSASPPCGYKTPPHFNTNKIADKGTLTRKKTHVSHVSDRYDEVNGAGPRRGSLDSLRESYAPLAASEDEHQLVKLNLLGQADLGEGSSLCSPSPRRAHTASSHATMNKRINSEGSLLDRSTSYSPKQSRQQSHSRNTQSSGTGTSAGDYRQAIRASMDRFYVESHLGQSQRSSDGGSHSQNRSDSVDDQSQANKGNKTSNVPRSKRNGRHRRQTPRRHTLGGMQDLDYIAALIHATSDSAVSGSGSDNKSDANGGNSAWERLQPLQQTVSRGRDREYASPPRSMNAWIRQERLSRAGSSPALFNLNALQPWQDVAHQQYGGGAHLAFESAL